jgi:cation transporter-like permease
MTILTAQTIIPATLIAILLKALVIGLIVGLVAWLIQAAPIPEPLKTILYWFTLAIGILIIVLLLITLL